MITNIPIPFPIDAIDKMSFGDPDAAHDDLIKTEMCRCAIKPVREFLKDKTSILIGERGSGKTGLFELLKDKVLSFDNPKRSSQIIVAIDQPLDYKSLKEDVINKIATNIKNESLKYRAVWELLFINSILRLINKKDVTLPSKLKKFIELFRDNYDFANDKPRLSEILFKGSKKIGIKFETNELGLPTADVYAASEPSIATAPPKVDQAPILLSVGEIKNEVNDYLRSVNAQIYIFVDKIDEFVTGESYEIQKLAIQGLFAAEKSYQNFDHLRLKLFVRADLYKHVDLTEFGADKVKHRTIELIWTAEDIREFLSKRIVYNYLSVFQLPYLELTFNEESLYVDRQSNSFNEITKSPKSWLKYFKNLKDKIIRRIRRRSAPTGEGRHTNFNDELNRQVLESFLGDRVLHYDWFGNKVPIKVLEYLQTHFALSSSQTTPRLMLMLMEKCCSQAVDYYKKNQDLEDKKGFPMIPEDCVLEAYGKFKEDLWEIVSVESKQWGEHIETLKQQSNLSKLSFQRIREIFPSIQGDEIRQLFAVMEHLGIVKCENKVLDHEQRIYLMPLLFQKPTPQGRIATSY